MSDSFFVVVTHDPDAYGGVPDDQEAAFFWDLGRALNYRDSLNVDGAPYTVFAVSEIPESATYEWAVKYPHIARPMVYVNERAARSCVRSGGQLLRRRAGSEAWEHVPMEAAR